MRSTAASADPVGDAVAALRSGRPVLVLDDDHRENEGDLVLAAELAQPSTVNLMLNEGRGLVCVAAAPALVDRLHLPQMVERNSDSHGTAFTVSVDACTTGTGISAADRAATIRALANPSTRPEDLRRPGHIFPLRAVAEGLVERRGHTEAAVELAVRAGLAPAAAICEVLDEDGAPADCAYLTELAARLEIPMLHVDDIALAVTHHPDPGSARVETASIPNRYGSWKAVAHSGLDDVEHLALVLGDPAELRDPLVRVHSECLTSDVFGSRRCDCGEQLDAAMAAIAGAGAGVVIYLRGHEGRGIGLVDKIRAYALQEQGCDTVEANTRLGLPVDARDYTSAAALLRELGIHELRLLSNNPHKASALRDCGIAVLDMIPVQLPARPENERYLRTKRRRLGHHLALSTDEGAHALPGPSDHTRYMEGTSAC